MPIAFFCKAKPQDCDAFTIFSKARRVFIGHPLLRDGTRYNPQTLRECLVNPSCSEEVWNSVEKRHSIHTRNRNFVHKVNSSIGDGAIVLIPRPAQGVVYLALISGPFEIVNAPTWGDDYLSLRAEQNLDRNDEECHHVADVAQGWPVADGYRPVPLSRIPGWLRRSTLGRLTYNELGPHPLDQNVTAYALLERIYAGEPAPRLTWTYGLDEIKSRLVETLTPNSFEQLVVSLLQLEHPDEVWQHTGGPGDGGIDGLGSDGAGNTVGLVQAKFFSQQTPEVAKSGLRCYSAVLLPEHPKRPNDDTILLDLDWIARTVQRHCDHLPQALTMRVAGR